MCDELREQLVVLSASREGSRTGQEQVVAAAAMERRQRQRPASHSAG